MSLLGELQRRNVFRVATFYLVADWVLLQAGDLLFNAPGVPAWAIKLLLGLLLLGLPFALVFAWAYELMPEGLKREHSVTRRSIRSGAIRGSKSCYAILASKEKLTGGPGTPLREPKICT